MGGDYLSDLPENLKEKILVKLPIKDAARTSILSSKWKDFWTSIPSLVFIKNWEETIPITLVDNVLMAHHGPILKFKLVTDYPCNEAIGRWMLILSRNGIRDLDLSLGLEERCKIPSRLVSCHALEHLKLSGCIINVPRFFQGFKLLRTLWLEFFDLSGISIGNLISSCPLLEDLALSIEQPGCLHILAPNLRQLNIWGEFHDLCLETPKLASGSICVVSYGDYRQFSVAKTGKKNNFTQALGSLHNVQKLALIGQFIDYLAVGAVPKNLPMNFNHLIELSVHVCCYDQNQTASALCLFQNAPNLRVLHIEFMDYWGDDHSQVQIFWKLEATETCLFKSLEIVKVGYLQSDESSFRRTESLLEFAELVLSTAPVLEKLNIIDFEDAVVFCTKLEHFSKLSKKAKIAVVNRWN